jgi:hypothetical protein
MLPDVKAVILGSALLAVDVGAALYVLAFRCACALCISASELFNWSLVILWHRL